MADSSSSPPGKRHKSKIANMLDPRVDYNAPTPTPGPPEHGYTTTTTTTTTTTYSPNSDKDNSRQQLHEMPTSKSPSQNRDHDVGHDRLEDQRHGGTEGAETDQRGARNGQAGDDDNYDSIPIPPRSEKRTNGYGSNDHHSNDNQPAAAEPQQQPQQHFASSTPSGPVPATGAQRQPNRLRKKSPSPGRKPVPNSTSSSLSPPPQPPPPPSTSYQTQPQNPTANLRQQYQRQEQEQQVPQQNYSSNQYQPTGRNFSRPNQHPGNSGNPQGPTSQSLASGIKAAATGIHGAGETLRGTVNAAIDRSMHEPEQVTSRHDAVAAAGRGEITAGKRDPELLKQKQRKLGGLGKLSGKRFEGDGLPDSYLSGYRGDDDGDYSHGDDGVGVGEDGGAVGNGDGMYYGQGHGQGNNGHGVVGGGGGGGGGTNPRHRRRGSHSGDPVNGTPLGRVDENSQML